MEPGYFLLLTACTALLLFVLVAGSIFSTGSMMVGTFPINVVSTNQNANAQTQPCSSQDKSNLDFLWKHIHDYTIVHPLPPHNRLYVKEPCTSVTGNITNRIVEDDGDAHISLAVDKQYLPLVTSHNKKGELVVEVICWDMSKVTVQKFKDACNGVSPHHITIPPKGTHVTVIGSYVYDTENQYWGEIHPVAAIYQSK